MPINVSVVKTKFVWVALGTLNAALNAFIITEGYTYNANKKNIGTHSVVMGRVLKN